MIQVSVIIPIYNGERYLEKCIESLLNQSFDSIEIICVNDASTDSSLGILMNFTDIDKRVTVLNNHCNMGAGYSRNVGMKVAKGKYVMFLDSDDFFNENMIELLYTACEKNEAEVAFFDYATYDNETGRVIRQVLPKYFSNRLENKVFGFDDMKDNFFQMFSWVPWNRILKKDFVLQTHVEYQELKNADDLYFTTIVMTYAKRILYVQSDINLLYYRINLESQLTNNIKRDPKCVWKALCAIKSKLDEKKLFLDMRCSFNSKAIEALLYSITNLQGIDQEHLYDFIKNEGLFSLGMINCEKHHFCDFRKYKLWRSLKETSYEQFLLGESVEIPLEEDTKMERLFAFLKNKKYRCALWGAGKLGNDFLEICEYYKYSLNALIDEDLNKQGTWCNGYQIDCYEDVYEKIDVIIITNSNYLRIIEKRIDEVGRNGKLILDVMAYQCWETDVNKVLF